MGAVFDPSILDSINMLENPNCTAETVQLSRDLMLYNVDDDNCLDYVYALLNFCGYLIFPRFVYRNTTFPFCSYEKQI